VFQNSWSQKKKGIFLDILLFECKHMPQTSTWTPLLKTKTERKEKEKHSNRKKFGAKSSRR
jgi:hypothetical protein